MCREVAIVTNKQAGEARDEMVQEFCFGCVSNFFTLKIIFNIIFQQKSAHFKHFLNWRIIALQFVLVSTVQQCESAISIDISLPSSASLVPLPLIPPL